MNFRDRAFNKGVADVAAQLKIANMADIMRAATGEHGLDLLGLGVLGAPTAYEMATGDEVSPRWKHIAELGGLGILAAHPAKELFHTLAGQGSSPNMSLPLHKAP